MGATRVYCRCVHSHSHVLFPVSLSVRSVQAVCTALYVSACVTRAVNALKLQLQFQYILCLYVQPVSNPSAK